MAKKSSEIPNSTFTKSCLIPIAAAFFCIASTIMLEKCDRDTSSSRPKKQQEATTIAIIPEQNQGQNQAPSSITTNTTE